MNYEHFLIRYAELSLKGKNRGAFERKLKTNIKEALKDFPTIQIERSFGRMFVKINENDPLEIAEKLKNVFGIYSFSPAVKVKTEEKDIYDAALWAVQETVGKENQTFKVTVKRINKDFPIRSQEMNHRVGSHLLRNIEALSVDVHHPEIEVKIEIRDEAAYISSQVIRGAGGLPVGTSGRVMLMLSGGIDSPVAGYLAAKRGVTLDIIHFHSPPYTNERAKQKVIDLATTLSEFGGRMNLYFVNFTTIQTAVHKQIPDNYEMTVTRRFMLRIAHKLAIKTGSKAIVNGESLGQVASQTLESMVAINEVTNLPILRPLVTMDKLDVIDIAKKIGTYQWSILPYEDCCTIFLPSESKTKPNPVKANKYESWFNIDEMVDEALEDVEKMEITSQFSASKSFDHLL